jgi:hypothetical protein
LEQARDNAQQPRSRGFSTAGFSLFRCRCALSIRAKRFQPLMYRVASMVLALMADVSDHPIQIARPEAHDSVTLLPLKHFLPLAQFAIHVV